LSVKHVLDQPVKLKNIDMGYYFTELTAAFSQLFNAFLAGNRDQSFSSRSFEGEQAGVWWCKLSRPMVDMLLFWQPNHCYNAYHSDNERTYS
jgi:hypothetical protein